MNRVRWARRNGPVSVVEGRGFYSHRTLKHARVPSRRGSTRTTPLWLLGLALFFIGVLLGLLPAIADAVHRVFVNR